MEFTVWEIFKAINKWKILIISIIVLSLSLAFLYVKRNQSYTSEIIISYKYSGAEKGLDPAGGTLDVYKIMQPALIQRVINEMGLEISVDDIREKIAIIPVANEEEEKIKKSKITKGETYEYFSTDYIVSYTYPSSFGAVMGITLLDNLMKNYDDYFRNTYSNQSTLPDSIKNIEYSKYDYIEICDILNEQVTKAIEMFVNRHKENKDFRSNITGMGFADVEKTFEDLRNFELKKLNSFVWSGKLSKNKEKLISKYEYLSQKAALESNKKQEESNLAGIYLNEYYEKTNNSIAFEDKNTEYNNVLGQVYEDKKITNVETTYDDIILRYVNIGVEARKSSIDVERYTKIIDDYKNDTVPQETKDVLTLAADEMIVSINKQLTSLINISDITLREYFNSIGGKYISYISAPSININMDLKIYLIIAFILAVAFGIVLAIIIELIIRHKNSESEILTSSDLSLIRSEHSYIEKRLLHAVKNNCKEFEVFYQPIVNSAGVCIGAEALLRWNDSEMGLVLPNDFIVLAERLHLMNILGEWVLVNACIQCKKWNDEGNDIGVSVNVSIQQINNPDFLEGISNIIKNTGVNPSKLTIEITESSVISDMKNAIEKLSTLRSMGIKIAMDKFGTGHSSIKTLNNIPLDLVKIDRSFVTELNESDSYNRLFVTSILNLAQGLNFQVCTEGIETREQMDTVSSLGDSFMQGYHFGRPIPAEEFEDFINVDNKSIDVEVENSNVVHSDVVNNDTNNFNL